MNAKFFREVNIMKDYDKSFINDVGIEEWTTTDSFGNEVHCYADEYAEVHTKVPICECGTHMIEETEDEWYCPKCRITKNSEELCEKIYPQYYLDMNLAPHEDFGEYKYMAINPENKMFEAGVPDYYLTFFHIL